MPKRSLLFALPLLVFALAAGFFLWGLHPDRDPDSIPSTRLGKPAPTFALPAIEGVERPGLESADLSGQGVVMVNIFASWCLPCKAEHPLLTKLAEHEGVTLMGINYQDKAVDAAKWLDELGNPYSRIGADSNGRVGIDWGITGVPETFILNTNGEVVYRHVGPLHPPEIESKILPAIEAASRP